MVWGVSKEIVSVNDEADRSDEKIAAAIEDGIDRVRRQAALFYTGECHYCCEPVKEPYRFCDSDCRDDYDAEQKARRRCGA